MRLLVWRVVVVLAILALFVLAMRLDQMTLGSVLLTLALVGLLYLGSMTLVLARRLSAQLAVLTIRVTDLVERVEALDMGDTHA